MPNRGGYESAFKSDEQYNNKKPLKIGYFADGIWSHEAFKKLIIDDEIFIQFICVRFDTKDEILLNFAKKYNIDYLKHENINSKEFIEKIKKYSCDLFVSMSFNQIFKNEIINLPLHKTINCHAGKLPFYRGRNILNWALINDEKEFGITVHYIDEGIDTGDIILQRAYPITDKDSYKTLLQRAYNDCADILYDAIIMFKNGIVKAKKQLDIHPVGFYCSQRKIGDEVLDWNQTSREIFNFVRAICKPGPIARAFINNKEMKINRVEIIEKAPKYKCVASAILNKDSEGFLVKTNDSFIKVVEFEYEGKIKVGDRFDVK
ncbi:MAG: methionyl-tRNA formyltransferase [Aliarcobacter sp.]|nr:methionyl-tRNA formyltransferase [Aliarcobacter sp.]